MHAFPVTVRFAAQRSLLSASPFLVAAGRSESSRFHQHTPSWQPSWNEIESTNTASRWTCVRNDADDRGPSLPRRMRDGNRRSGDGRSVGRGRNRAGSRAEEVELDEANLLAEEDLSDILLVSGTLIGQPVKDGFFVRTEYDRVIFVQSSAEVELGEIVSVAGVLEAAETV